MGDVCEGYGGWGVERRLRFFCQGETPSVNEVETYDLGWCKVCVF